MREIKFRAWDKRNKSWHPNWFSICHKGFAIYDGDGFENEIAEQFELSQYTGLKDKNGVEIYEGDMIDCKVIKHQKSFQKAIHRCKVVFNKGMFYPESIREYMFGISFENCEVIGNIYENPELLNT